MIKRIRKLVAEFLRQWRMKPLTREQVDDAIRKKVSDKWQDDFLDINKRMAL